MSATLPSGRPVEKGMAVTVTMPDGSESSGRLAYVRMAGPDYTTVAAVSVVLDENRSRPGYAGTIFSPDKVA